jgi:hypothetical protein
MFWLSHQKKRTRSTGILPITQSKEITLQLHIESGYHRFTLGFAQLSNPISKKKVKRESVQSRKNLDRLPHKPFEKNTVWSYQSVIDGFCRELGDAPIDKLTPDDILDFLNRFTNGNIS